MLKVQIRATAIALVGLLLATNVGVAESAENSTRRTASLAPQKADGLSRTLRHETTLSQRTSIPFQFPVGVIIEEVDGIDWIELMSAYSRSDIPSIVGPIEVVDEFSVTDLASTHFQLMAAQPEEGRLVVVTTVNLVDGFVLEPGEEVYIGDKIEDGLFVNVGETAFTIRLANGSETVLPPTTSLAIVPTKAATCCAMCTSCETADPGMIWEMSCLSCEACNDAGLPYERDRARNPIGTPCIDD